MKFLALPILLGAIICALTASQYMNVRPPEQDEAPISVDQILNQHLQAIGGKAAFDKLKSRVMKGTYALPTKGYSTTVEVYAKAPNKYAFYMTGEGNTAARGFNGELGWSRNYAEEGLRTLAGAELLSDQREADFYREINLRQLYPTLNLKGKQKVGGRDVLVIEASTADANFETLYFDAQTSLLVRRDVPLYYSLRNVEVYFDNYKQVDGVKLPFTIRIVRPTAPFMTIFAFEQIKHNVKIDDTKFEKPGIN